MQIHELTTKKINEGIADFFGLNNPEISKVWGKLGSELVHNLSTRYTKDPRYTKITDLAQRKRAIEQDEYLQRMTQQYVEAWNKQINELEIRNGAPLTNQQYQQALLNWLDKVWFKGKLNSTDPAVQNRVKYHAGEITKNRNNGEMIKQYFGSLAADQAAREVEAWTTVQQQQQQPQSQQTQPTPGGGAPKTGTPTAREEEIFQQAIANAIKAKG